MPSLLPGYEYDIFISYRHNDNRSGWVTEFVQALQEELVATIKEPLSVYNDTNPHDGLLEIHNVDKSLEGKLKCLIFIPILSQTYCDPKSFAWQHEFCAFNKLAQDDQLGRDIKLGNGNVASRILPVKIHALDADDTYTIENEIGGVLRAIEFIYKEPGVNRPLKITDERSNNQNQTDYRNQVNKVANAIKEIVYALNPREKSFVNKLEDRIVHPTKNTRKLGAIVSMLVFVLALIAYFVYPKLIPDSSPVEIDKSIAVLPFVNMSGDAEQEYFSDGISEELINALAKLPDMKVTGRTSSFAYKGKNENLQLIGKELGVSHILEGSVRKSGNTLRITAQLINVGNGFHMWTETYDRELEDVFKIQDEITEAITKQLKIRLEKDQRMITKVSETNLGAYEIYMKARQELALRGDHLYEAQKLFKRVIELDPDYSLAYSGLGITLSLVPAYFQVVSGEYMEPAKVASKKAIAMNPNNAEGYSALGCIAAFYDWNWKEAETYFQKSIELNPNDTEILNFLGDYYSFIAHPKAIQTETKAMELDPLHSVKHADVARAYFSRHLWQQGMEFGKRFNRLEPVILVAFEDFVYAHIALGHFEEAKRLVNAYPNSEQPIEKTMLDYLRAIMAVRQGQNEKAKDFLPVLEAASETGALAPGKLARMYVLLDMKEEAVKWFEKAVEDRDYYVLYEYYLFTSEELTRTEGILKSLGRPEFDELIKIRRKNLSLDPVIQ